MSTDFKTQRVKSSALIASKSDGSKASFIIYSASNSSNSSGGISDSNMLSGVGLDTFLFVSGGIGERSSTNGTTTLFGGDLHVSGNLTVNGSSPGGGSPGGSNTQVQFNDAGSFGGDSGLIYNSTSKDLTISSGVTGSVLYGSSFITSSYLDLGVGDLAGTGDIRLTNNSSIVARNAANTQDISMISLDSSDNLHIGDGATNPSSLVMDVQSSAVFRLAGTYELALYPSYLDVVLPSIIFRDSETSPILKQGDSTGTGKGESLTLQAQNMSGVGSTGGNLVLSSGTGDNLDGSLQLSGSLVGITGSLDAPQGLSGSLTRLSDGTSYLVAGTGMSITSESNGSISLSATTEFSPDNDMFSLTNLLSGSSGPGSPTMGSDTPFTSGVRFIPLRARTITGVRFWAEYSSNQEITVKLWYDGSEVADSSETVLGGSRIHEVLFSTPYTVPTDLIGKRFIVSLFDEAGTGEYPKSTNAGDMPATPFVADPHYLIQKADIFANGDNEPDSDSSEYYMLDPIFQKITS